MQHGGLQLADGLPRRDAPLPAMRRNLPVQVSYFQQYMEAGKRVVREVTMRPLVLLLLSVQTVPHQEPLLYVYALKMDQ